MYVAFKVIESTIYLQYGRCIDVKLCILLSLPTRRLFRCLVACDRRYGPNGNITGNVWQCDMHLNEALALAIALSQISASTIRELKCILNLNVDQIQRWNGRIKETRTF